MFYILKEMFGNDNFSSIDSEISKNIIGNAIISTVLSVSCKKKTDITSGQYSKPCSCMTWELNEGNCNILKQKKINSGEKFCTEFKKIIKNDLDSEHIDAICSAVKGTGVIMNSSQLYNVITNINYCPSIDEIKDKFANIDLQKELAISINNIIDDKLNENNAHIVKNMFNNDKNADIINNISIQIKTRAYVNIQNIVNVLQYMITECGGIIDHAIQSAYIDSTINTLSGYNADGTTNSNTPPNDIKDNINKLSKELEIILGKVKQQQQQNNTKKIIIFSGIGIVIVIIIIIAILLL